MEIEDLLPDRVKGQIERINGVYQFKSYANLTDVLKTILANDDTSISLRKNGLEIFGTFRWTGVGSTGLSLGMLISGQHLGMNPSTDYLLTFEPSEDFLKKHSNFVCKVDLIEMLRDYGPYKWGSSIKSAMEKQAEYLPARQRFLSH